MKNPSLFVTGTDTEVGKTLVAAAVLHRLVAGGLKAVGMKPVASGCRLTEEGLRNDDALSLMEQSNVAAPYGLVNPYCFEPAIAPHIAAAEAGVRIELNVLRDAHAQLAAKADALVIEGAGGWLTPLTEQETLADFARMTGAQVILVVGLRLGCINHALLTAGAIEESGLGSVGWVANTLDPHMPRLHENVRALQERLRMPLLGVVPHAPGMSAQKCAAAIQWPPED